MRIIKRGAISVNGLYRRLTRRKSYDAQLCRRPRRRQSTVRFILAATLLLPSSAACSLAGDDAHPSDSTLVSNFRTHEGDFSALVKMAEEDAKVVRIDYDFTWLEDNYRWPRPDSELGFSVERWDEYRSLFKKLRLEKGVARQSLPDGPILLLASTRGMVTGGSAKGYVFSRKPLSPLSDSLDHVDQEIRKKNVPANVPVYRSIKDGWYLFYQGN